MLRTSQCGLCLAPLDDAPALHHRHLVCDVLNDPHVAGNEPTRQAQLAMKLFKQVEDLATGTARIK